MPNKSNWKTTLLGILFGALTLFGPRLSGDKSAPPLTAINVVTAIAGAAIGVAAKDHNSTN